MLNTKEPTELALRYNRGKPQLHYILTLNSDTIPFLYRDQRIAEVVSAWGRFVVEEFLRSGTDANQNSNAQNEETSPSLKLAVCASVRFVEYHLALLGEGIFGVRALLADVFSKGAEKYAKNNWRKGLPLCELLDSMMRHLDKMERLEAYDEETGLLHAGHFLWNVMVIHHMSLEHPKLFVI